MQFQLVETNDRTYMVATNRSSGIFAILWHTGGAKTAQKTRHFLTIDCGNAGAEF